MHIQELTTIDEWTDLLKTSHDKKVWVFKHSTTCPISAEAWSQYQKYIQQDTSDDIVYTYVKVIESRPVSNQVAEGLGVEHASPQAILVKSEKAVWHDSHWNITEKALDTAVQQAR
ncbi:bacillithiol system redox-active protein YtxJ [Caldalkalibacillus salinus]|uniref:bacillithiol system redox-active protein YtxJ n=1 Tax=Caldalkalibacillus salinus TaxID=2803787 RepID=UPI003018240E